MGKPFHELRERLLRAGVAPRHVRRYLAELSDHLVDLRVEEERAGLTRMEAESVALARLGRMEDLAGAMIDQRKFRSWCVRAPWAAFGLAPVFLLAAAWLISLLILWSGWQIFVPRSDTPFVRLDGADWRSIYYFAVGRVLFFGAPIFIGWGIGVIAARQRYQAAWPAAGLILIAWIGGMAQVHASRSEISNRFGHISMNFTLGNSVESIFNGMLHVLVILALTVLPYLIGQIQKAYSSA